MTDYCGGEELMRKKWNEGYLIAVDPARFDPHYPLKVGDKVRKQRGWKDVPPSGWHQKIGIVEKVASYSTSKTRGITVLFDGEVESKEYWEDCLDKVIEGE